MNLLRIKKLYAGDLATDAVVRRYMREAASHRVQSYMAVKRAVWNLMWRLRCIA